MELSGRVQGARLPFRPQSWDWGGGQCFVVRNPTGARILGSHAATTRRPVARARPQPREDEGNFTPARARRCVLPSRPCPALRSLPPAPAPPPPHLPPRPPPPPPPPSPPPPPPPPSGAGGGQGRGRSSGPAAPRIGPAGGTASQAGGTEQPARREGMKLGSRGPRRGGAAECGDARA